MAGGGGGGGSIEVGDPAGGCETSTVGLGAAGLGLAGAAAAGWAAVAGGAAGGGVTPRLTGAPVVTGTVASGITSGGGALFGRRRRMMPAISFLAIALTCSGV